jgi:competence ComEA-like helix-hairpin-helix protein
MRWVILVISAFVCVVVIGSASPQDGLPEGKGKDVIQKMCQQCHSLEQATGSKRTKKSWQNVVDDMVTRGAEGSDSDVTVAVSYLSQNFGKPININTATAKEIGDAFAFTSDQSEALVRYRSDSGGFKKFEDLRKVPGLDPAVWDEQKKNIQF